MRMGLRLHHLAIGWVIGVSIGLILLNLQYYPPANGRDEIDHLTLIQFYADNNRFPVLPDDYEIASEQAHQPPLYYLLTSTLVRLGIGEIDPLNYEENPFLLRDNYNPDLPPYNRVLYIQNFDATPIHILRWLSVSIILIGVAAIWKTVYILFDQSMAQVVAPLTLAFLMLTPSFWRTAIIVNNNQLVFMWASLATWQLAYLWIHGFTWRRSVVLGTFLGLGLLTKLYMLPLLAATAGLAYLAKRRAGAATGTVRHQPLWAGGVAVVVAAGWACAWYVRNMLLYQDPTASRATETLLDSRRTEPFTLLDFLEAITTWSGELWIESWNILNTTETLVFASTIGTLLILSNLLTFRKNSNPQIFLWSITLPTLIFAIAGAIRNTHADYTPPLLLAAYPSIHILFALGVWSWISPQYQQRLSFSVIIFITALTVMFHGRFFTPLFPPISDDATIQTNIEFENDIRLTSYEYSSNAAQPDDWIRIKLCWQTDTPQDQDYAFTLQLVLPDMPRAAIQDGYHLSGRYPTSQWAVNETICEWIPLHIQNGVETPRAYELLVSLYEVDGEKLIWVDDPTRDPIIDRITIYEQSTAQNIDTPWQVADWGKVAINLDNPNQPQAITLTWQVLQAAPTNYRYYIHLLDETENIIAQADAPPLNNTYPTSYWVNNTTFTETILLPAAPDATQLKIGVYDPNTNQRGIWQDGTDGIVIPLNN